jgi:hypothetical protein
MAVRPSATMISTRVKPLLLSIPIKTVCLLLPGSFRAASV